MRKKPRLKLTERTTLLLRTLRKARNLSQIEVAERLGKDQSAIARWERGESEPRLSELLDLAEIYQCALGHLVKDGDGLTAEERELIRFLRDHPQDAKILMSTYRAMEDGKKGEAA